MNKRMSTFDTPDEESIPPLNEPLISTPNANLINNAIFPLDFGDPTYAGLTKKEIRRDSKEIISDFFFKISNDNLVELETDKLRDKIRLWYSERRYNKVTEVAKKYIVKMHEKSDLQNLSYEITSLYVKSLIRVGDLLEAEKQLYKEFGKHYKDILINTEKAYIMWENGRTESAITLIRHLLNERPNYNAGKNCLAFYLCDSVMDDIANEITINNEKLQGEKQIKDKLSESLKLLSEVFSTSDLIGVNSYFWSNVGFYHMLSDNFQSALNYYIFSLRSKENIRSRMGMALISLSRKDWQNESVFHFKEAISHLNNNRSSRYWNISKIFLNIIETLIKDKRRPDKKIIFFTNRFWREQKEKGPIIWNIERLLKIVPLTIIPEYAYIKKEKH